jgi:Rho GTPase-activating protein 5
MDLKGIYRKNGSAAEARSLMKDFTDDPFNFHIMRINDESSNVAADVLRAFFRQLLEPLIPIEFHKTFYHIAELSDPDSRIEAYRATLAQFSIVNFNTIRRLMSHLNEVAEHSDKNMASIDNLAKVFGPTVFGFDKVSFFHLNILKNTFNVFRHNQQIRLLWLQFEIFLVKSKL